MATVDQSLFVPLAQGVDTRTDANSLPLGKLVLLENARFDRPGSLQKRTGTRSLPRRTYAASPISSSLGAVGFRDDLVHFDGQVVRQWIPSAGRWSDAGHCNPIQLSADWLVSNPAASAPEDGTAAPSPAGVTQADSCLANGFAFFPYNVNGSLYVKVQDAETGQFALDTHLGDDRRFVQVAPVGSTAYAFYVNSSGFLCASPLSPIDPSLDQELMLVQLNPDATNAAYVYDVTNDATACYGAIRTVGDQVAVAKYSTGVLIADWARTLTVPIGGASRGLSTCVGTDAQGNELVCVASIASGSVYVSLLNPATGAEVKTKQLNSDSLGVPEKVTLTLQGGVLNVWVQEAYPAVTNGHVVKRYRSSVTSSDFAAAAATTECLDAHLATKAFVQGDRSFVVIALSEREQSAASDNPSQDTLFILDSDGNAVGRLLEGESWVWDTDYTSPGTYFKAHFLPKLTQLSEGSWTGPVFRRKSSTTSIIGTGALNLEFDEPRVTVQQSNALLVAGGYTKSFDGTQVVEQGFNNYPTITSQTTVAGSAVTAPGTRVYCFAYWWQDAAGQDHISAPSDLMTLENTSTGSFSYQFTVKPLHLTDKQNVRLVGYRTLTDSEGVALNQFRQFTRDSDTSLVSDPSSWSITVTDSTTDDDLLNPTGVVDGVGTFLYDSSGELDNDPCPANVHIAATKNRVWVSNGDGNAVVYYSKLQRPGVPSEFSLALSLVVDQTSGPITALGALDDLLVVFKRSRVYLIEGEGPDNTGNEATGVFQEPKLVSLDVGCVNPKSVVNAPGMLIFESEKGLYALAGGQTTYIGDPAAELFAGKTIVGAQVVPDDNQVRFALAEGGCVVYDYLAQQWCTYTHSAATSSTTWDGAYAYSKTNGAVVIDDPSTYTDDHQEIRLRLKTGLMSFSGIQGYQRVKRCWVFGDYVSSHKLKVRLYFDGSPAASEQRTFDVDQIVQPAVWGDDPTWGASAVWGGTFKAPTSALRLQRQKCRALQVELIEDETAGEGLRLRGLGFLVGSYPGLARVPDRNRQ